MFNFQQALEQLKRYGVLLLSDAKLPSVSSLVAGSPVRGSWWVHPRSHEIFRVASQLADLPNVVTTKLISGKVTFVYRKLWPALFAVGTSCQPWQMRDLSSLGRSLLAEVTKEGSLRTDELSERGSMASKVLQDAARHLEKRLLVHGDEVHTESGAHAKILESWDHWSRKVKLGKSKIGVEEAQQTFEEIARSLNFQFDADGQLPWNTSSPRKHATGGRRQRPAGTQ